MKLRTRLGLWLLGEQKAERPFLETPQDAVVEANQSPTWTPNQTGNVVIAEPPLVTMARAQGDKVDDVQQL